MTASARRAAVVPAPAVAGARPVPVATAVRLKTSRESWQAATLRPDLARIFLLAIASAALVVGCSLTPSPSAIPSAGSPTTGLTAAPRDACTPTLNPDKSGTFSLGDGPVHL